jgi:hypothetical protein
VSGAAEGAVALPEPRPQRRVAASTMSPVRNLRSFAVAVLLAALTVLFACAIALLIAESFYGYGGLG